MEANFLNLIPDKIYSWQILLVATKTLKLHNNQNIAIQSMHSLTEIAVIPFSMAE